MRLQESTTLGTITLVEREVPQHRVSVEEFKIGKYPVTNFQYQAFVQDTGHEPPLHWDSDQYPEGLGNHPVVKVSWDDAVAYCRWLSEKTGKPYRLPYEDEWEKAARGGLRIPNPQNPGELVDNPHPGRRYPWGDEFDRSRCNTREGGPGTTTPVDQYSRHGNSPYRVADMAGNVWEWCDDWLGPYKGNSYPDEDYGETHKVLRGSSWETQRGLARCAFRYARRPDDPSNDIGFRYAKSSPRAPAKTRQPVNWEKVGAIAQVIALLIAVIGVPIALGTWLWPNVADSIFARPSETPTVTPTSSPTQTPVISTATPTPPTPTLTPRPPTRMPVVLVPAGEFTMGSDEGEHDEQPVHTVHLNAFYMDKTEVTNAQYRACVEAGTCNAPSDTTYYDDADYAQHPVVFVTWTDADAYCQWTDKRLPTEAEWEKAARGIDGRTRPWGEGIDCDHAQYIECGGGTASVGSKPKGASQYGALDMVGNVAEWVADWYDPGYYSKSPSRNPHGPDSGGLRVLRGGSWSNAEWDVRCAARDKGIPGNRYDIVGFRCARGS